MDQEPVGQESPQVDSKSRRRVAQVRAAAEPCSKAETVRRQQLTFFLTASTISAVPVGLQVLALLAVWSTPDAFPHYDAALLGVRFWPVQIILVSLGLCGNALLDFTRAWAGGRNVAAVGIYPVAGTAGALLMISVLFAFTLLNTATGWAVIFGMAIAATGGLLAAYRVNLDLALAEEGLLAPAPAGAPQCGQLRGS